MRNRNVNWRIFLLYLMVAGACGPTWAQNVVFTAEAAANRMGTKDQIQIQYTIRDAENLQSITRPVTNDFVIVQGPFQSTSTSSSFDGNRMTQSRSVILSYIIQPRREGTFTIPPVIARDAEGHTYQSNALTIQVVPGTVQTRRQQRSDPFADQDDDLVKMMQHMQQVQQQMQQQRNAMLQQLQQQQQAQQRQQPQAQRQAPGQQPPTASASDEAAISKDLFIRVAVDKNKVHVGEQITASYKLYARLPMQVSISKLPSLNGFWTQDFELPRQAKPVEEVVDGKKYQVFLLKKSALFAQQTGTLELDPAEAKGVARIVQQVKRKLSDMFADPFGAGSLMMNDPFFNNNYYNSVSYRDVQVSIKSAPVKITVTEDPEKGKPAGFGGAVGNFTISGKLDKQDITTDDVANLTITINGSGNIKLVEAPKLEVPNGISVFDPAIIDTITSRSTTIAGSKILTYVLTPHTPGDYTIPAVSFSYFDPKKDAYVTEQTQPFTIHVRPGKHYAPPQAGNSPQGLKDIHDLLKKPAGLFVAAGKPLFFRANYWSLFLLPVVTFAGIALWKRREEEESKDTLSLRKKRANRIALQRLATARKLLQAQDKTPFYEEISKAIWLYLSDKLSIPLSALSRETAAAALQQRKIGDELFRRLEIVVHECETALYASGGSKQMAHTYEEAIKVISDLEDAFKA